MRAVLVTGASTGIGHATVVELLRHDAVVYAGVRKDADAARLSALDTRVRPVMLDVTDAEDIASAAARIRSDGLPLAAVVCNAGIAFGGPLEFTPVDRLRRQFEVNFFGAFAVAQAMLPMLRESRGRLLFVGSISGRITPPFIGPYASSKAALAALSDALRFELDASRSGVSVSLFEFGDFQTPIWSKGRDSVDRLTGEASAEQARYYGFVVDVMRTVLGRSLEGAAPVDAAARILARAALGRRPRARYVAGSGARLGALAAALLPVEARGRLMRRVMGLP